MASLTDKLIVAISSRALFDLDESNAVFEDEGIEAFSAYQIAHENEVLAPGAAFQFVKKLLNLNQETHLVEVVLLSRNSADTGLRVFNSIEHHNLNITRAAFSNGNRPYPYLAAFGAHLFLSANPVDVREALSENCAAAQLLAEYPSTISETHPNQLRIAFDGDSVLFSKDSEAIFQEHGLQTFVEVEKEAAEIPLPDGPFRGFLSVLHEIQQRFPFESCPIRTALVTARSAPTHERVIRTLRAWGIRIDEALFLGGLDKGEFLKAFGADIFFDDQEAHCESASAHVAAGHVPTN